MSFEDILSKLYTIRKWSLCEGEHLVHEGLEVRHVRTEIHENFRVVIIALEKVILPGIEVDKYIDIHNRRNTYIKTPEGNNIPVRIQNMSLNMPVIDVTMIENTGSFTMPVQGVLDVTISVCEQGYDNAFASLFASVPIVVVDEPIESRFDILDL